MKEYVDLALTPQAADAHGFSRVRDGGVLAAVTPGQPLTKDAEGRLEETLSGTGRLRRPVRVEPVSVPGLCELPQGQQWHRLRVGGHLGATAVDTNRTTSGDDIVPPFSRRPRNEHGGVQRRWCRRSGDIHKLAGTAGAARGDL